MKIGPINILILAICTPILVYRWYMARYHTDTYLERLYNRKPDLCRYPDEMHIKKATRGLIAVGVMVFLFVGIPLLDWWLIG